MLRNVSNHFSASAPAEWDVHILRGWNVCTMVLRYAELMVTDQVYAVMHFHSLTNVHFSYARVDYLDDLCWLLPCYNMCVHTVSVEGELKFKCTELCIVQVSGTGLIWNWFPLDVVCFYSLCYRGEGSRFVRYKVSYINSSLLFVCVAFEHEGN